MNKGCIYWDESSRGDARHKRGRWVGEKNVDGTYSNCVKDKCSQVSDIFKTMTKIDAGEIEVF